MATYILIAGAWPGSWGWSAVSPLLEAEGHRVLTPDLLGMTPGAAPLIDEPIRHWADQIATLVREQEDAVVLVGHSRAGLVISEVAERVPERIALLVYLCAFFLSDGETLADVAQRVSNAEAFGSALVVREDATSVFKPSDIRQTFYNKTLGSLANLACERLVPEPMSSFATPVHITEARFGSVPRAHIECGDDRAIPPASQRAMQQGVPVAVSRHLDSDHSPFFSQPRELVAALEQNRRDVLAPAAGVPDLRDTSHGA